MVSAIVLYGAVLAYYLTEGDGEASLQSNPPRTAAVKTVTTPPPVKPVLKPKPMVTPNPAPAAVEKPPAPKPTRQSKPGRR